MLRTENQVILVCKHKSVKILGARYLCKIHEEFIQDDPCLPNIFKGVGLLESKVVLFVFLERLFKLPVGNEYSKQFWSVLDVSIDHKQYRLGLNADLVFDVKNSLSQADKSTFFAEAESLTIINSRQLMDMIEAQCLVFPVSDIDSLRTF